MSFRIIDGASEIDLEAVMRLLKQTYWADHRPIETVRKSMENSACFGVYLEEEQKLIGFARVISDLATTYYLCDVIIDADYRHMGYGKALISYIESLEPYRGLRGILVTMDAQPFYRTYGFEVLNDRVMVKQWKK